jgi:hypothetical protein
MKLSGGCLCGNVRFATSSEPLRVGICHCRNCQRHTGSGFLAYAKFLKNQVEWTGNSFATYGSSADGERGFCGTCGSTLSFSRDGSEEISIASGSFDNPNVLDPSFHIFVDSKCEWLQIADSLPKHAKFPQ